MQHILRPPIRRGYNLDDYEEGTPTWLFAGALITFGVLVFVALLAWAVII